MNSLCHFMVTLSTHHHLFMASPCCYELFILNTISAEEQTAVFLSSLSFFRSLTPSLCTPPPLLSLYDFQLITRLCTLPTLGTLSQCLQCPPSPLQSPLQRHLGTPGWTDKCFCYVTRTNPELSCIPHPHSLSTTVREEVGRRQDGENEVFINWVATRASMLLASQALRRQTGQVQNRVEER